jgi:hypothetical protein
MNKLSTDIKYRDNFAGLFRFPLNYDRKNNIDAAIRNNFFSSVGPLIPRIFDSYLGDFAFYDEICEKNGKRLILLNSSKRFNFYYNLIRQQSTLGVHLRLGDFLQHKSSVGCLSDSYFLHSINRLTSFTKYDQVLVFSDSVELATERIAGWELDIPIELVSVKEDADPAEDLILLSLCTGIVCSNSTFSFWAAKLASLNGRDELAVVIPEEFRRDGQTCVSSIPKTWLLEPSRWD